MREAVVILLGSTAVATALLLLYIGFGAMVVMAFNSWAAKVGCQCGHCEKRLNIDQMTEAIIDPWPLVRVMFLALVIGVRNLWNGKPFSTIPDDL